MRCYSFDARCTTKGNSIDRPCLSQLQGGSTRARKPNGRVVLEVDLCARTRRQVTCSLCSGLKRTCRDRVSEIFTDYKSAFPGSARWVQWIFETLLSSRLGCVLECGPATADFM